ncbi:ribosomal protein S2 [Hordeum vulgare]|nr:ribosomal protein S2 [Hordeum vulgare]
MTDQVRQALLEVILSLLQYVLLYGATLIEEMVPALWGQERCGTVGTGALESPSHSGQEMYKAPHVHLMLSSDSDSESVNQRGGSDVPPLTIDLNRPTQDQEDIRQYAESIKDFRIDEQFENFKRNDSTSPLYDQLCAYVGDADVVKNKCIREISENFHSTDAGLIDFVNQTDDTEGQRRVIWDLIKLHFQDELDKIPPKLQQNANQEEE